MKNKYQSQQISKKFKNKHRKNRYNLKSGFSTKCGKLRKILQRTNCKFGSKKELRRLRKVHLRKCNWCQHQTKLQKNIKATCLNHIIEDAFDYLSVYGHISDDKWTTPVYEPTHRYVDEAKIISEAQTGMIFDELYNFEETYDWKSVKYQQKNKYLSQKIHKKFKNKSKRKKIVSKSGLKKRLKQKGKKQCRQYNKASNVKYEINCNGYEYQDLYNELCNIDEFDDNECISEIEDCNIELIAVEKNNNPALANECLACANCWKYSELLQCNLNPTKQIIFTSTDHKEFVLPLHKNNSIPEKWTIQMRCKILGNGLNKLCRATIAEIVDNHHHNEDLCAPFECNHTEPSHCTSGSEGYNVTGYILDKTNDWASIIIEDMDENIKPLWNRKINVPKQDFGSFFEIIYGGERVLFNIFCYVTYKHIVNYKINGFKYVKIRAYNVRLPKQRYVTSSIDEYHLLIAGYLKIYLNRFDMYIPYDIENLILWYYTQFISNHMEFCGRVNSNGIQYFTNRYIMCHKNVPMALQRYNVIIDKVGLKFDKKINVGYLFKMQVLQKPSGYVDLGIVYKPRAQNIANYLIKYNHQKDWYYTGLGLSAGFFELEEYGVQNGDKFELTLNFQPFPNPLFSLALYKKSRLLKEQKFHRTFEDNYHFYIAFEHTDWKRENGMWNCNNKQDVQFGIWNIENIDT